jgi:hypothetical protein
LTVRIRCGAHRFHRDLPDSRIWAFEGCVPGPTIAGCCSPASAHIRATGTAYRPAPRWYGLRAVVGNDVIRRLIRS